jgi:dihydroorotase
MKVTREPLLLLRGARRIDVSTGLDEVGDVFVRDGRIEPTAPGEPPPGTRVVDASGLVVCPAFTDLHVHLREPGGEPSETVATGCASALRGGVTTIYAMANTNPVNDRPEVTGLIRSRAEEAGGLVRVRPVSAVTKRLRGEEYVDFGAQVDAGAGAFSDDGRPVASAEMMAGALERAEALGRRVFSHSEEMSLSRGAPIRESDVSRLLGVAGVPPEAESVAVARDVAVAETTGLPIHLCHVSTAASVRIIRDAKARGVRVTAETAPHYLALTVDRLRDGGDTRYKMNPPLGEEEDLREVRRGLAEGVFDAVATDHAPHEAGKKAVALDRAAFGVIGLETLWPVLVTRCVDEGLVSLTRAIAMLTTGPASVIGEAPASLAAGSAANLVVLDLGTEWTVEAEGFASRSRNCPFDGWNVRGWVRHVLVGDRWCDNGPPGSRAEPLETT